MFDFLRTRPDTDARHYQVVLEQEEDGTFVATSPALPGYVAYGPSEAAAARKLRRAIRRNLEGFAADHVAASSGGPERTSRHKSSLHFQLPLTTTAKIVLGTLALAGTLALLSLEVRRRQDR
jgi:predicted RNase H-like HicB family nuclease